MSERPVIASLWIGAPLTFLEQLCLQSFVDAGHRTKLYVYDTVGNVPDGVEIADANEILPATEFIVNAQSGKAGPHSDKFRYHLLSKTDEIWVDTDAYCTKPFPEVDYLFGNHFNTVIANGVLRLPKDSPTLAGLLEFTSHQYPDLPEDFPFVRKTVRAEYEARRKAGNPMHVSELPWEIWGPFAITHFAWRHDEAKHTTGKDVLYPISGGEISRVLQMPWRAKISIPEETLSVHFYGSKIRNLLAKSDGVPHPRSFLGRLCEKHGINPANGPITKEAA
ncbi:hypothetical protein [Marivita hallyeonensis]|uniref:Alpha 1,4-glycosyltransferase conserved region n=1 Tax=Marivita hallyeonensis TaxID=996342 RepID=A0A1M5WVJ0_9RHOB|nr:hypothetical protein [Marivita hallyeonensis]SHH91511.1 hypothetical protein SAMN05443551_3545 [Marivita hallyeonensis]